MKETKAQKGITLIALVITIIVMLILVGVTIRMAVNGGLFKYAENAAKGTNDKVIAEQELSNGGVTVDGKVYSSITEYLNKDKEPISKETSYVGKYADVDGDGDVDGIIYADLAVGTTGKGNWRVDGYKDENGEGDYEITQLTEEEKDSLKDYYVSKTGYVGTFGETPRDVITATGGNGNERFYVMALSDIITSGIPWYESKSDSEFNPNPTSEDFGAGKENTAEMIRIWNEDTDVEKNSNDLWGQNKIQTQAKNGWFVPSRAEWAAFGEELKITTNNYEDYGLVGGQYWSSSLALDTSFGSTSAWTIWFELGCLSYDGIDGNSSFQPPVAVRLSTTF